MVSIGYALYWGCILVSQHCVSFLKTIVVFKQSVCSRRAPHCRRSSRRSVSELDRCRAGRLFRPRGHRQPHTACCCFLCIVVLVNLLSVEHPNESEPVPDARRTGSDRRRLESLRHAHQCEPRCLCLKRCRCCGCCLEDCGSSRR